MKALPHPPSALLSGRPAIAETEWPAILASYAEPQRHYHTWAHIQAVLAAAEALAAEVQAPRAVYLACIYHDIVYVPGQNSNEAQSAQRLRDAVAAGHIEATAEDVRTAEILIETSGGEGVDTPDGRLFWDIDRSILAAAPAAYKTYATAVRAEFSAYSDMIYRLGRKKFLKSELARPSIFRTSHFQGAPEHRARENITAEIAAL
jgi:predicted metal-dependent HD superfamily phosphohydrolase